MKIVLDTNAYSDWRRDGRWNGAISKAELVCVPAIVLGELRYGFLKGKKGSVNEVGLCGFLGEKIVQVLEVSEATSRCYASLKWFLKRAGTPIPENDVWIAALAVEHGMPLVTGDVHFDCLPQVARVVE